MGADKFVCEHCGESFKVEIDLQSHQWNNKYCPIHDPNTILEKECNDRANAKIAELEKEIERLKYWNNEKDEEADTERVSIAVAEVEADFEKRLAELEKENKLLRERCKEIFRLTNVWKLWKQTK